MGRYTMEQLLGKGLNSDLSSLYAKKGVTSAQYQWAVQTGTYKPTEEPGVFQGSSGNGQKVHGLGGLSNAVGNQSAYMNRALSGINDYNSQTAWLNSLPDVTNYAASAAPAPTMAESPNVQLTSAGGNANTASTSLNTRKNKSSLLVGRGRRGSATGLNL